MVVNIERLQKFMASCGIASRRKCEEYILNGNVTVNGEIITTLGYKVDSSIDIIKFQGKDIKPVSNMVYIMLNKPEGVICSAKDEKQRMTVIDLVDVNERIYPVGRLDYDSSGLIILTNDGNIYNKIIHPSKKIDKKYIVKLTGIPNDDEINHFNKGIDIGGYITSPAEFKIIEKSKYNCNAQIIIHEGKNRQIRRMCDIIGHPVLSLKREAIGNISLGNLQKGKWRRLTQNELDYIFKLL